MSDENSKEMFVNDVEIFSTNDQNIKMLAEIISNESSRTILSLLFREELTANEIANKTKISLSLVRYHLEKMQRINLVVVSKVEKNSKAHDMNYYKSNRLGVVITHPDVADKAKQSKLLKKSFKSIYRFFGVGAISVISAFSLMVSTSYGNIFESIKSWYESFSLPIQISGSGLPDSIDESFYLAKSKVDSVVSNPGSGSGTPYLDPYVVSGFTISDLIITLGVVAVVGCVLSLPFFLKAYQHSKKFPNLHKKIQN